MLPYLFQIYGPIYANCYGIAIAVGLLVFTYLVNKDARRTNLLSSDILQNTILWSTLVGILGGRLLWIASNWPISFYEAIELWEGGFSVLGAIISILLFVPFYARYKHVNILKLLDLAAIYAPLLQSISRVGCFLAGCCYGIPTGMAWGVVYTHPDVAVPMELKNIPIHPTQLYSALVLFIIFLLMHNLISKKFTKPGQLIAIYLMLSSIERFMIDFLRADQEFFDHEYLEILAIHQWLALVIFISAFVLFKYASKRHKFNSRH